MISVDVCQAGRVRCNVAPRKISELVRAGQQTVWIDVANPDEEDWRVLTHEMKFHALALEDARKQNQRAKVDAYHGYLFLTIRHWTGVREVTDNLTDVTDEIDVFLGPNYLVTIHHNHSSIIQETRSRWERHPELMPEIPAFLLYVLLDTVVDSYFPALDIINDETENLETTIYATHEPQDIGPALLLKKRLMLLRQTVAPMRDVINALLRLDQPLIPAETRLYYQDVYDHTLRLVEQIDLHRDILSGAMDALMAQTNNHLNQVMRTLTALSTILMSAALISGIYGMNFAYMPELHTRYGYFGALAGMVAVSGGLAAYFKRIRWL